MKRRWGLLIRVLIIGIALALACTVAIGIVSARRSVALTMHYATAYKLRHALQIYLYKNNTFPPRISSDPESGKQVSWRVLLELTESGQEVDYDFQKVWSSPNNTRFARHSNFIKYYSYPSPGSLPIDTTTFVAIDDLESILRGELAIRTAEVKDGLKNTLLVAQVPGSDIPWSEPRDMNFDEFARVCGTDNSSVGYTQQLLLFGDGEIYRIVRPIPMPTFKALWTRAAGDGPDREDLIRDGYMNLANDQRFRFD